MKMRRPETRGTNVIFYCGFIVILQNEDVKIPGDKDKYGGLEKNSGDQEILRKIRGLPSYPKEQTGL